VVTLSAAPFVTQLRDEIEYGDKGMVRKYLVRNQKQQAMLICLQAGIHIPKHTSSHDGFITVIQGRGVFLLAGQEVVLEPGVFVELPANTLHALTAIENLAMLKVVDQHESKEPAVGNKKSSCQESLRDKQPKQSTCAEVLAEMLKPYLREPAPVESVFSEPQRDQSKG
jgi:quercetin dioxygenase-like cupin family protein